MLLIEIVTPKVSPLLKTTNFAVLNDPQMFTQVISLLDKVGYTDGNVNYVIKNILMISHTVQLLNHMITYDIPISDDIMITAIKRLTPHPTSLKHIINQLKITDNVWDQLTSLKVYDFPNLLAVYPNIPEKYIIQAINTNPKYANKIQNILTKLTPGIEQVLTKLNKKIAKKLDVDGDDLNSWSEKQLIAYFKKLPVNQLKVKLSELQKIPESVAVIAVRKQPYLISIIPTAQQSTAVQMAAVVGSTHNIFNITNPDPDVIEYAFTKSPHLYNRGVSSKFISKYITPNIMKRILTSTVLYIEERRNKPAIIKMIQDYFKDNALLMNKWLRYAEQQMSDV
jgi:hypothetical protein